MLLKPDKKELIYIYVFAVLNGVVNLSLPLGVQAIIGLIIVAIMTPILNKISVKLLRPLFFYLKDINTIRDLCITLH